jgi:hypothetical protein
MEICWSVRGGKYLEMWEEKENGAVGGGSGEEIGQGPFSTGSSYEPVLKV